MEHVQFTKNKLRLKCIRDKGAHYYNCYYFRGIMDEYVESIRNGLKESKYFFSNPNKQNRELWVLREFLTYLPIIVY